MSEIRYTLTGLHPTIDYPKLYTTSGIAAAELDISQVH
jgi:hypothetical protein